MVRWEPRHFSFSNAWPDLFYSFHHHSKRLSLTVELLGQFLMDMTDAQNLFQLARAIVYDTIHVYRALLSTTRTMLTIHPPNHTRDIKWRENATQRYAAPDREFADLQARYFGTLVKRPIYAQLAPLRYATVRKRAGLAQGRISAHGDFKSKYVEQPKRYRILGGDIVYQQYKFVIDASEAPHLLNEVIDAFMISFEFLPFNAEPCTLVTYGTLYLYQTVTSQD